MAHIRADFELAGDGTLRPSAQGGSQPGSGRPKGYSPKQAAQVAASKTTLDDPSVNEAVKRGIRKQEAVIDKAEWEARRLELKYRIESGQYLSRSAFREASATLLAELAQALRGLPDLLERKAALNPKQAQLVEDTVNGALKNAADSLELFFISDGEEPQMDDDDEATGDDE